LWSIVKADYDHTLAIVRAELDEAAFVKARAQGRKMATDGNWEQAIAYALEERF
jgi:hypothetical protein